MSWNINLNTALFQAHPLSVQNIGGVFVVLLCGLALAIMVWWWSCSCHNGMMTKLTIDHGNYDDWTLATTTASHLHIPCYVIWFNHIAPIFCAAKKCNPVIHLWFQGCNTGVLLELKEECNEWPAGEYIFITILNASYMSLTNVGSLTIFENIIVEWPVGEYLTSMVHTSPKLWALLTPLTGKKIFHEI